jgi:hypothetical protein
MAQGTARQETASIILARGVAGAFKPLVYGATVFGCVYVAADALKAYAGRTSLADLHFLTEILANGNLSLTVTVGVTVSGWAYGLLQRALRRKTTKRLQTRVIELESKMDKGRSSSELTPEGRTRREDRY